MGSERFYPSLIEFLRDTARFDDVVIFRYRAGDTPSAPYTALARPSKKSAAAFVQGLYMQSPFYEKCTRGESGFSALRDIAPDDFFESEFYKSTMKPSQIQDEAGFVVQADTGYSYFVSLGRTGKLPTFSDEAKQALSRLTPIVERSVNRHEVLCAPEAAESDGADNGPMAKLSRMTPDSLTEREREIIGYLVRGYSSKACARELDISPATERVHRKNIYEKLGVNSQSELLANVFEGLLS